MNHKDAFLCHASEDKAVARKLSLGLAQYGVTTWFDEAEMRPGDRLVDKLGAAIHPSRWFIVLLTHNSVAKAWVKFELSQAWTAKFVKKQRWLFPSFFPTARYLTT
jgi:hypothetical protein